MSKHESLRTRMYWNQVGGLLIEEFVAVSRTKDQGARLVDGVIVLGEEKSVFKGPSFDIDGKDIIIIQTKGNRIGMYLLGQAYFSKFLMEKFNPRSIKAVAICGQGDPIMVELAAKHDIEVVVIDDREKIK